MLAPVQSCYLWLCALLFPALAPPLYAIFWHFYCPALKVAIISKRKGHFASFSIELLVSFTYDNCQSFSLKDNYHRLQFLVWWNSYMKMILGFNTPNFKIYLHVFTIDCCERVRQMIWWWGMDGYACGCTLCAILCTLTPTLTFLSHLSP